MPYADIAWIEHYFRDFDTSRFRIKTKDLVEFRRVLEKAKDERPMQLFLQEHPQLLCCYLRSGHGEWVIPQKRLGQN